jgi:hypothetical protein
MASPPINFAEALNVSLRLCLSPVSLRSLELLRTGSTGKLRVVQRSKNQAPPYPASMDDVSCCSLVVRGGDNDHHCDAASASTMHDGCMSARGITV